MPLPLSLSGPKVDPAAATCGGSWHVAGAATRARVPPPHRAPWRVDRRPAMSHALTRDTHTHVTGTADPLRSAPTPDPGEQGAGVSLGPRRFPCPLQPTWNTDSSTQTLTQITHQHPRLHRTCHSAHTRCSTPGDEGRPPTGRLSRKHVDQVEEGNRERREDGIREAEIPRRNPKRLVRQ
jgi:hypothetical protein